jgi:ankyrin repeat protein
MGNVGSVSRSIIQRIHSNGADINSEVADNGATLLHLATVLEDKQAIKELLDNGASVNVPDKSGQLPLHLSLSTSNAECAEILLEAHIKEETEKLQESLRKSSELANNQLHCLQTDLDSNNNTNRENVNMNLSMQPSHDSEELFEPYHSTNSVSDSIMQRNETERESVSQFQFLSILF